MIKGFRKEVYFRYMENMRQKVFTGFIWRFMERIGAQGVSFIVSLILARLLTPEDYGQVALITVFITILNTFATSGIGTALIQKKNADNIDYSTVFYFNILFSFLLYGILFLSAPLIGNFYRDVTLIPIIRVLGITIVVSAVNNVQQSYVSKTMQFRRFFYSTLIGTVFSGIVGVFFAYNGFGTWAIVIQQLVNQIVNTVILWVTVKWRPTKSFSLLRLKTLYSFGWKLLFSGLIDTVYNNIYSLVIGKFYDANTLGLYNKGVQFPNLIVNNINGPIQSVLLPAMSYEQNNKQRIKEMVRRSIKTSTYLIFPLMIGMAAVARPLVILLLTEKWIACVPFLQISCITLAVYPIHTANLQAINALGRSDIFLKLEIIKKIVGLTLLVVGIPFGVYAMVWLKAFSSLISTFINAFPNKKLLNYSYWEQIKDLMPSIGISICMGICVLAVEILRANVIITLLIQVIVGIIVYLGLSKVFKLECFVYIINAIKKDRRKD